MNLFLAIILVAVLDTCNVDVSAQCGYYAPGSGALISGPVECRGFFFRRAVDGERHDEWPRWTDDAAAADSMSAGDDCLTVFEWEVEDPRRFRCLVAPGGELLVVRSWDFFGDGFVGLDDFCVVGEYYQRVYFLSDLGLFGLDFGKPARVERLRFLPRERRVEQ